MLCVNEEIVRADSFQNLGTETNSPLNRLLADPLSETRSGGSFPVRKFTRQISQLALFTSIALQAGDD
jgi:hypothetical protein